MLVLDKEENMAKEKMYKFAGQKLTEQETHEAIDSGLKFLINANEQIIDLQTKLRDPEIDEFSRNQPYKTPLAKFMIDTLNKTWDNKIAKEKEKNAQTIESGNFKKIAKDVGTSLKTAEKFYREINGMISRASDAFDCGDERFSFELMDFVNKVLVVSNEIFQEQLNFNSKFLEPEQEGV